MRTFETVATWTSWFLAFVLLYLACYRLEDVGQMIAFVFGCALMHLSGHIDGARER